MFIIRISSYCYGPLVITGCNTWLNQKTDNSLSFVVSIYLCRVHIRGTLDFGHKFCDCRPKFLHYANMMEASISPELCCYITLSHLKVQNNCVSKMTP